VEKLIPEKIRLALGQFKFSPTKRMVVMGLLILIADQVTKRWVLYSLGYSQELIVLEGFFKLVHWGNTGAAWSLFYGYNKALAGIAAIALIGLFLSRHHFDLHTITGQIALGFIFGGILGNLIDRVRVGHVIDFLYFYLIRKDGEEFGFPAFNIADSAICVGVGLLFLQTFKNDIEAEKATST
jgi:signal peptidase II